MTWSEEAWIEQYKKKDALWLHDGNPKRPHALLASKQHSNGFFNSRLVIPHEELLEKAASDLLEHFMDYGGPLDEVDGVIGPQTGATKLAELIKQKAVEFTGTYSFSASPAKSEANGVKSMVFTEEEKKRLKGSSVLLCEDVLTTGESVELVVNAATAAGAQALPFILVLVNRSGLKEVNQKRIVALIDRPMPMWAPKECPLCKEGSKAIPPKDNWAELNAHY